MQYRALGGVFFFCFGIAVCAQEEGPRAKPPQWSQEVRNVFFEDVRKKLVGERPDFSAKARTVAIVKPQVNQEKQGWTKLIESDILTSEIKRVVNDLAKMTAKAGVFKSDGYRQCQRDFQLLAMWFGVVSEYDEGIRWQRDAGALHEYLQKVAAKCEEGNDESLQLAQGASEVLAELIRGQMGELPKAPDNRDTAESDGFGSLMQRLKLAVEQRLDVATVDVKQFRKSRYEVAHEAQIIAVLAQIMGQEPFDYSEDETFLEYAQDMQQAATEMGKAAQEGDFRRVEQASVQVKQACAKCHEDYRG